MAVLEQWRGEDLVAFHAHAGGENGERVTHLLRLRVHLDGEAAAAEPRQHQRAALDRAVAADGVRCRR